MSHSYRQLNSNLSRENHPAALSLFKIRSAANCAGTSLPNPPASAGSHPSFSTALIFLFSASGYLLFSLLLNKFPSLLLFWLFTFSWAGDVVETPLWTVPSRSGPVEGAASHMGVSWRGITFTTNNLEGAALLKIPSWTKDQKKSLLPNVAEKYLSEMQCSALCLL